MHRSNVAQGKWKNIFLNPDFCCFAGMEYKDPLLWRCTYFLYQYVTPASLGLAKVHCKCLQTNDRQTNV